MKKGIYLQATVDTGGQSLAAVQAALQQTLAGAHEGLTVQVKRITPVGGERAQAILYIEGEQPPPEDFEALTTGVVRQLWQSNATQRALGPALSLRDLVEKDDYEDEEDDSADLVLPPQPAAPEEAATVAKEPATPAPSAEPEEAGAVAKEPGLADQPTMPETAAASTSEGDTLAPTAPVRGEQVIPTLPPTPPPVTTGPGVAVAPPLDEPEPAAPAPPPAAPPPSAQATPVEAVELAEAPTEPPPQAETLPEPPKEAPAAAPEPTPPPGPKPRSSTRPPRSSKRRSKPKGRRGR